MSAESDRTTAYAESVVSGEIAAGPHIRAACSRHIADRERSDIRFDVEAAEQAIQFFGLMTIKTSDGLKPVGEPLPWQCFVIGSLLGWKLPNGRRRFRKAYVEAGRASGKTPMIASVVVWTFLLARHIEPDSFFAAGGGDKQAQIGFMDAVRAIENDPALSAILKVHGKSNPWKITGRDNRRGSIRKTAADTKGRGVSGSRVFVAAMDEFHESPTDEVMRQFESTATKTENSMVIVVTNAGAVPVGPCWDERLMALSAMEEETANDRLFAYIAGADEGDDWGDEVSWEKGNPGMIHGVPDVETVRTEFRKGQGAPSQAAHFRRFYLCEWSGSGQPFVEGDYWEAVQVSEPRHPDKGAFPPDDELKRLDCVMGVDIGQIRDLTSVASVHFDPSDPTVVFAQVQNFTLRSTLLHKKALEGTDYPAMAEAGYIAPTAGETTDYRMVADYIQGQITRYGAKAMAVDAWRFPQLHDLLRERGVPTTKRLSGKGLVIGQHPHGFAPFGGHRDRRTGGAPKLWMMESIESARRAIIEAHVRVKFNPLLTGAVLGAKVIQDGKGNMAFTKRTVKTHDDPLVALVMAFGMAEQYRRDPGIRGSFSILYDEDSLH